MVAVVRTKAHRAFISVVVACRKEAGLTQAQLAKACKKSQSWIAQIESGQRGFQIGEIEILAKGLKLDARTLLMRYLAFLET